MLSHCGPSINECTKSFVVESPTSGCGILKLPLPLDNAPLILKSPVTATALLDTIAMLELLDPRVNVTPDVPVIDALTSNLRSTLSVPFPMKTSEEVSPKDIPLLGEVNSKLSNLYGKIL